MRMKIAPAGGADCVEPFRKGPDGTIKGSFRPRAYRIIPRNPRGTGRFCPVALLRLAHVAWAAPRSPRRPTGQKRHGRGRGGLCDRFECLIRSPRPCRHRRGAGCGDSPGPVLGRCPGSSRIRLHNSGCPARRCGHSDKVLMNTTNPTCVPCQAATSRIRPLFGGARSAASAPRAAER